jgi:hypothetical protein
VFDRVQSAEGGLPRCRCLILLFRPQVHVEPVA